MRAGEGGLSALAELQDAFKRYLLAGDNEPELAAGVRAACGAPAEARLDVYRNAYYVRLQEALAHDFPAVLAFLGDAEFGRVTAAYLSERPSTRPSLRWLGERFEGFLLAANAEPAAADLARLEWAVLHALDAPDKPRLGGLQELPAERWPGLRVVMHPSVSLLSLHVNARAIWTATRGGRSIPALRHASEQLIAFRAGSGVSVESLDPNAHALLLTLAGGRTLGEACDELLATLEAREIAGLVAETLHRGLRLGWFVRGGASCP